MREYLANVHSPSPPPYEPFSDYECHPVDSSRADDVPSPEPDVEAAGAAQKRRRGRRPRFTARPRFIKPVQPKPRTAKHKTRAASPSTLDSPPEVLHQHPVAPDGFRIVTELPEWSDPDQELLHRSILVKTRLGWRRGTVKKRHRVHGHTVQFTKIVSGFTGVENCHVSQESMGKSWLLLEKVTDVRPQKRRSVSPPPEDSPPVDAPRSRARNASPRPSIPVWDVESSKSPFEDDDRAASPSYGEWRGAAAPPAASVEVDEALAYITCVERTYQRLDAKMHDYKAWLEGQRAGDANREPLAKRTALMGKYLDKVLEGLSGIDSCLYTD